jgi:hypothetical protein
MMPSPTISVWMPRSCLSAVADLQRGAVRNQLGDVLADGFLHRADLRQADFKHRLLAFDQRGHLRDMDMAVAVGERHVRIDFEHDGAGLLDGGHGVVGAEREREVAVLVHRRGHAEDDIGRDQVALDELRQFGEIGGDEVDPAFLAARTRGSAEEVGGVADVVDGLRVEVAVFAQRQDLRDLYAAEVAALLGKGR